VVLLEIPQAEGGTGLCIIQRGSEMKNEERIFYLKNREDAVSEAIGFILIFSLVMVGIGLITLYGYPVLLEQQSNANVKNMERDMIVLQNDMKSLVYKNVPYKETSLQVSGGALAVHNAIDMSSTGGSTFIIEASDGIDSANINSNLTNKGLTQVICGQLRYESDAGESIIALENGAVLTRMEFQNGSAMLAEPRWFIDENPNAGNNTFIITFMNITSDEPMSRNGIGTVKMKVIGSEFYTSPTDPNEMTVEITYNSGNNTIYDFSKAWDNYLKNSLKMNYTAGKYSRNDINTLVVKRYDIKIINI
jgi:hypothetical protein